MDPNLGTYFLLPHWRRPPMSVCSQSFAGPKHQLLSRYCFSVPRSLLQKKTTLKEHLKWGFRLQLSIRVVALPHLTVALVHCFVTEQDVDAGGPAAAAKDSSRNQRPINQSEDTSSRGVKTEHLVLTYGHLPPMHARYCYRLVILVFK